MSAERFERLRSEVDACADVRLVMPSDLLLLPSDLQVVLRQAYREGRATALELAAGLALELPEAQMLAELLVVKGYLQPGPPDKAGIYLARFGGRGTRSGQSPLDRL